MIESAEEFVRLRTSVLVAEYRRAAHEEASLRTWRTVVENHPDMRAWVARNKTVPLEILRQLAGDPDPQVRSAVADRRKLTPDIYDLLAADSNVSVRMRVAYNKKTPAEVIGRLAADPDQLVRDVAAEVSERRGLV